MKKNFSILAASLFALLLTSPWAAAQCRHGYPCSSTPIHDAFHAGYHANVQWPAQYVPTARRSVLNVYDAMVDNGWRRQNLLGTYHFDPNTNELTHAGKLKVNWIMTQTPPHRRNIFVQRAADPGQTEQRIASTSRWAANLNPDLGPADVTDTHIVAEGHPAGMVDHIFVGFQANQPPPILPPEGESTSSSSSSGQ